MKQKILKTLNTADFKRLESTTASFCHDYLLLLRDRDDIIKECTTQSKKCSD